MFSGSESRFCSRSSIDLDCKSARPSSALLRLVTYAPWCLSWWISMVLASIWGSRASNGYGSGGTVNATGFSSDFEFELGIAVSVSKRPGRAAPAPIIPAPTTPEPERKRRRFMVSSNNALSRVRGARGLYRYTAKDRKTNWARQRLKLLQFPFALIGCERAPKWQIPRLRNRSMRRVAG